MHPHIKIRRIVNISSSVIAAIVAFTIPLLYLLMSYESISSHVQTESEMAAREAQKIITFKEDLWVFEESRLLFLLEEILRETHPHTFRIVDEKKHIVAQYVVPLKKPVITRSSPLYDYGKVVGRIDVSESLGPVLLKTAVAAIFSILLGFIIYFPIRLLPLRTLEKALRDLETAEEQIRQDQREWENAFDSISDPLFIHDREFRVLKANRAYLEASGMSFEGRPYYEVFPKMKGPFNGCRRALELQEEEEEEEEEEVSLPSIDKVYKVKFYPVRDVNGSYLNSLHILEDITEYKRLEAQLRHSQKMEAVGALTGGMAHDFNNILTAIIGYASVLQMKMGKDDPLRLNTERILAAADRAARLTQSLLAFSRKQLLKPEVVNINEIIKMVEKLLSRLIGEDIELRTILSDEKLTVFADSAQLEQVLMNLATNARDAMPGGGLLRVETEKLELNAEFIKRHGYGKVGPYALISVSDTGIGMDEKTKERMFEPFFTTKEVGKGTGLGLSMVHGIIKQHNGYINGYSEVNKGTTFRIYLPLTEAEVMEIKTREEVLAPEGGTETILLAEDDEDVRNITVSALKEFGYKVIEAVDGEDAVNKFIKNKDELRLVLLDIVMPKKNGSEAYEEMKKIAPEIKALFMSGYTEDIIHRKKIINEGLNFLSKPLSPTKLLRLVREILDK